MAYPVVRKSWTYDRHLDLGCQNVHSRVRLARLSVDDVDGVVVGGGSQTG